MKKVLILGATVAIPVIIILILQGFGENEFEIPLYYQEQTDIRECEVEFPYTVPRVMFSDGVSSLALPDGMLVMIFRTDDDQEQVQVIRLLDEYGDREDLSIIQMSDSPLDESGNEESIMIVLPEDEIADLKKCKLLIGTHLNEEIQTDEIGMVLIDQERRIRGYYAADNRAETDRLIIEIDILSQ